MSLPSTPIDLVDLKMLPAWANEPAHTNDYSSFEGEDARPPERFNRGGQGGGERPRRPAKSRDAKGRRPARTEPPAGGWPRASVREPERVALPPVAVRFVPHPPALESVIAQIKSGSVAYSVFALARLFLDKPERYDVQLTVPEGTELYQLGENGPVALDRSVVESGAFTTVKEEFYAIEIVQSEPIKGNFTNVARCRLSGTLLGPTNHHVYQPQLRSLYEQRFSRRMSFADYQRQIEIVNDPAVVEQWKEQARSVTTFTTKGDEPQRTFSSAAEAERHFRQQHLPGLVKSAKELKISGVVSRRLPDRAIGRLIEDAWAHETRSPSRMMQELAAGLRQAGLNILRHRRGMLFVLPIRARSFGHERTGVSPSINSILEKLAAAPGINRKQLAEQLAITGGEPADAERAKHILVSDLRWLIREGYVIEFNDGSLDLPRVKTLQAPRSATVPSNAGESPPNREPEQTPEVPADPAPESPPEEKPAESTPANGAIESPEKPPDPAPKTDAPTAAPI